MMDSVTVMPKTLAEIVKIQEIIQALDQEMAMLSTQLYEFDQRNISGVEDLSRLDTLKINMERCRATLEEHSRWNQLFREAKTMIENGGHLSETADKLEILNNSLEILKCMPGNEERTETCQELTTEFLVTIEEKILHIITLDKDHIIGYDYLQTLQQIFYVYQKLKRFLIIILF